MGTDGRTTDMTNFAAAP